MTSEEKRLDTMDSIKDNLEKEETLEELLEILNITIKFDNDLKTIGFLACLLTYTEQDQVNLIISGETTIGKTYNITELLNYFPEQDIIKKHSVSKMAFWYDENNKIVDKTTLEEVKLVRPKQTPEETDEQYEKRLETYREQKLNSVSLQNFERKIPFLPDMPNVDVLQPLRPLMSHEDKIIKKLSTTMAKYGHMAKEFWIKGYATFIICSTTAFIEAEDTSRSFQLNPEWNESKEKACRDLINKRGSSPEFKENLEVDPKRVWLKERIKIIKSANINEIYINEELAQKIDQWFESKRKISTPRNSREYIRLRSLVKAWTLFNLWNRKRDDNNNLYSNEKDVETAEQIYDSIVEASAYDLTPEQYEFFKYLKEESIAFTIVDAHNVYYKKKGRICADKRLRNMLNSYCREGLMRVEKEKQKFIYYILECEKDGKQITFDKPISSQSKTEVLLKLLAPRIPLSFDQIIQQTDGLIPQNEVSKLLTQLLNEGRIFQPDGFSYQLVK